MALLRFSEPPEQPHQLLPLGTCYPTGSSALTSKGRGHAAAAGSGPAAPVCGPRRGAAPALTPDPCAHPSAGVWGGPVY